MSNLDEAVKKREELLTRLKTIFAQNSKDEVIEMLSSHIGLIHLEAMTKLLNIHGTKN